MENRETEEKRYNNKDNSLHRKFVPAAIIFSLLLVFGFVLVLSELESIYPEIGAEVIRKEAASVFMKEPNDLNDEDFAKVKVLNLSRKMICDIKLLENFENLEELNLSFLEAPKTKKPKWMAVLAKLNIYNSSESKTIDLSPLKNLTNLRKLDLRMTAVKNVKPLARLKNLEILILDSTHIENIKPLENLVNLREFDFSFTKVSDLKPIRKLTNLETLKLNFAKIRSLDAIGDLSNLQSLSIAASTVSNLKPIKKLNNLRELDLRWCDRITDKQVDDLKEALPELKIIR